MIEQRSPEWYAARCGKVTASCVAKVVAKTKTGYSASRTNYAAQLIVERLTGTVADSYVSDPMQFGIDNEAEARDAYCLARNVDVEPAGFVSHMSIDMAGASPDGYVGAEGLVEIKVPNSATHIDTVLGKSVPGAYITQIQFQLACTGRQWCDFVSYDPRMPAHLRLFVQRVNRDPEMIEHLEGEVRAFLLHVDAKVKALNELSEAA